MLIYMTGSVFRSLQKSCKLNWGIMYLGKSEKVIDIFDILDHQVMCDFKQSEEC